LLRFARAEVPRLLRSFWPPLYALVALLVTAPCAQASLPLTVNSFTKNSITPSISGTFAADSTGGQPGFLAIKNNWSSSSHVHTAWFDKTPTVTAINLVIGSIS
jgi:hypothetical protein